MTTYEDLVELGLIQPDEENIESVSFFTGDIVFRKSHFNVWKQCTEDGEAKYGVLDTKNFVVVEFEYDFIGEIESIDGKSILWNCLLLQKNGKFGVLNLDSRKIIVPCEYDNVKFIRHTNPIRCGYEFLIITQNNNLKGLISPFGSPLLNCHYEQIVKFDKDHVLLSHFGLSLDYEVLQGSIVCQND